MATLTSAQIEWLQTLGEIVGHGSAVHAAGGSGPGGGSRHTADKSKHLKGQVSEGDPTLVVVRKIPLGETRWRDHKGTLLGYTTAEGALVTKAPSPAWKKMAVCNLFGRRSVIAMADAETLDRRWRDALRDVQAGIPRGQALLVRVKQAADAISERKKNDPKFQQAVNQYFRQVDELRALSEGINKADAHYAETLHRLESTILGTEIEATVDQVNAIKEQEGDVEKDRVRAKQIFGQVLSLGTAIAGAGPFSAAAAISMVAKAADLIGNALIDGVYDAQIQQLEAKLHEAKGQLKELKSKKFHEDIAAAQEVVSQAISDCRSAAAVFVAALKDVGRSRAAAAERLRPMPAAVPRMTRRGSSPRRSGCKRSSTTLSTRSPVQRKHSTGCRAASKLESASFGTCTPTSATGSWRWRPLMRGSNRARPGPGRRSSPAARTRSNSASG